jgi:hypothetical protein
MGKNVIAVDHTRWSEVQHGRNRFPHTSGADHRETHVEYAVRGDHDIDGPEAAHIGGLPVQLTGLRTAAAAAAAAAMPTIVAASGLRPAALPRVAPLGSLPAALGLAALATG